MRPLKLKVLRHTMGWAYLSLVIYSSLTPSPPDLPIGETLTHVENWIYRQGSQP